MIIRKKVIFLLILFSLLNTFSNQRTLYVDDLNYILGSPSKENKLLSFAAKNNFNCLILYELNKVNKRVPFSNADKNNILADFIKKAKKEYGILQIGVSGEAADFFTDIIDVYNNFRTKADEKVDIYNLEFEYWSKKASSDGGYYCEGYLRDNNMPCNRKGSFQFFVNNLKQLKALSKASNHQIKIEAYVGYFTQNEIIEISKYTDRIQIQAFDSNPKLCFSKVKKSLEFISKLNKKTKISILFSTRMKYLGYWLKFDSLNNGEKLFFEEIKNQKLNLSKEIDFDGFSYNPYSYLEKSLNYYYYRKK